MCGRVAGSTTGEDRRSKSQRSQRAAPVGFSGSAGTLARSSIDIPVDYGFTVVDVTEPLSTFNTHASMFDAHPNERAHAVWRKVLAALERPR